MSGKPSQVGVQNFLSTWQRFGKAAEMCAQLRSEIETRTTSLKEWSAAYEREQQGIFKLMEAMDIHASGNVGYEGRMLWFLAEMWRQMQHPDTKVQP